MKKLAIMGCLTIGFLFALSSFGSAQSPHQYALHVPFDFTVGSKQLKAGDYTLAPAAGITNQRALILFNRSTGKATIVGATGLGSDESTASGKVTFVKDGQEWALGVIDTPRFSLVLKNLPKDKAELAVANSRVVRLQN